MRSDRLMLLAVAAMALVTIYSFNELSSMSKAQMEGEVSFHGASDASSGSMGTSKRGGSNMGTGLGGLAASKGAGGSGTAVTDGAGEKKCFSYEHTELWGDVMGTGVLKAGSAGECCDLCRTFKPSGDSNECNVWVFCGDKERCGNSYGECWLKHLAYPEGAKPAKEGVDVPWTAGTINVDLNADPSKSGGGGSKKLRVFHTVTTAQGAAVHWQMRIHYYWFKKHKATCIKDGNCEMGGFTRLLHSGEPDDLMDEIPTVVADPLPPEIIENNWYVVLNRPYAFVQWVKAQSIPEKYVLMAEPDHIYTRPMPNFMTSENPAAFPFFYIEPAKKEYQAITMKYTGQISQKELGLIAPVGNSPTFMTLEDMKKVMPIWMNTSIAIFKDPESNKAWGWVQEMYGFTIALYIAGIKHTDLYLQLMSQPPWDMNLDFKPGKPFQIIHYTYGMDYKLDGTFTPGKIGEWRFDKRTFAGQPIPRHLGDPPEHMQNDLVRLLINSFNEATDAIPCWDEYAKEGKVPKTCDEKPKHFLAVEAGIAAS